jgi:hypothetical protein
LDVGEVDDGYRLLPLAIDGSDFCASWLSSYSAEAQTASIIPAVRNFAWNPGMMSKSGIPSRTTICATLSPSGGDDSTAIQAALDICPSNQVVKLNPGRLSSILFS